MTRSKEPQGLGVTDMFPFAPHRFSRNVAVRMINAEMASMLAVGDCGQTPIRYNSTAGSHGSFCRTRRTTIDERDNGRKREQNSENESKRALGDALRLRSGLTGCPRLYLALTGRSRAAARPPLVEEGVSAAPRAACVPESAGGIKREGAHVRCARQRYRKSVEGTSRCYARSTGLPVAYS